MLRSETELAAKQFAILRQLNQCEQRLAALESQDGVLDQGNLLEKTSDPEGFSLFFGEWRSQAPSALQRVLQTIEPEFFFTLWTQYKQAYFPECPMSGPFIFNHLADFLREAMWFREGEPFTFEAPSKRPLIFIGPSLDKHQASQIFDAEFRPPIRRGDLPKAIREGYRTIGIVDGVFHQAYSVSLQEIREACEWGVKLYGSSSMGALRAAEAYPLGMKGVGQIYGWYRSGEIEADDEVALCFDENSGRALTVPLVNIRATLQKALRNRQIDEVLAHSVLTYAQNIPYGERTSSRILEQLRDHGVKEVVDQKALDAISLLNQIKKDYESTPSS